MLGKTTSGQVRTKLRTALREEQRSEGRTKPHERMSREQRDEAMRAITRQEGLASCTGRHEVQATAGGSVYSL
jgi:hypothetical protein